MRISERSERVGVVLPTRGMVFTEVEEAIERERLNHSILVFRSHDQEIPDGHNTLAKQALLAGAEYIWFIEEDTVPPVGGLDNLLNQDADIACIDYGVSSYSTITRDRKTGEILWCALGCTLVKREVLEQLAYPWFRGDKALLLNYWPEVRWIDAGWQAYGNLDIWFGMHAREKGFTIKQAEGECRHLQLNSLGKPERNKGLHEIGQKPVISKYQKL